MSNSSEPNLTGPAEDLGFSNISELKADLAQQNISPTELVAELTHRIAEIDDCIDGLNSVLAINNHLDEQIKSTNLNQPLGGIPILIKDNIESVGLPATAGSLALVGRQIHADAPLVSQLKSAGALILGSTNLSEWANIRSGNSTSGWSAVGGLTANPWKYSHSAGGSSSGSGAAVAAGLVPVAIGTETDGSIVCPAALNGIVGIKPTVGRVSTKGIIPISFSQDSPGPLARNVADATEVLGVLINDNNLKTNLSADTELTVGVVRKWLTGSDETNAIFENQLSALAKSGIKVVEIDLPDIADEVGADEFMVLLHELVHTMDAYLSSRPGDGVKSLADVLEFNTRNNELELSHFGQEYFEIAATSGGLNQKYHETRKRNLDWAKNVILDPALAKVDVLVGIPYGPAWRSDLVNGDDFASASWMTCPAAISGYPIASIPMGFVSDLPVGMGVIARANDEAKLVTALAKFEKVFDLADLIPTFNPN